MGEAKKTSVFGSWERLRVGILRVMARRKNESGANFVNVGLKVTQATRDALEDIGLQHDRPQGYIARKLVLRGIAAYHRDGLLDEPPKETALRDDSPRAKR